MGSITKRIMESMGTQIEVYVTAASSDRQSGLLKFWTQLDPHGLEQIEQQAEWLQSVAQDAQCPSPDTLEEGKLCMAKYLEDGRWYRARIESVTGNDIIAYFIDYGNTEIIPRNLVRTKESVGEGAFAIQGQATECVLAGVAAIMQHRHIESRSIKMGTHGYVKNILVDQTFIGEPLQLTKDGLEMKLFMPSGENMADRFIRDEFGEPRAPGAAIPVTSPVQKQGARGYSRTTLAVGSRENLFVSNVASLGKFWVQQASKTEDLDALMDTISAQYDSLRQGEKALGPPQEGSPCIANFSEDGANYRARVVTIQGSNQCNVQFVDFGNSEIKDPGSLKMITDDLLQYPAIAVECLLSGVNTESCSPRAAERFEELTAEKELCGKVVGLNGDAYSLLLVDPQGEENADIVNVLVKEGLASRSGEPANQGTQRGGATSVAYNRSASGDAGVIRSYTDPTIGLGSKVIVQIIAVRGVDDFSCQLMEDAEVFNIMMDKLQSDYSAIPAGSNVVKSTKVNQPCCVRFSEDDCWYRARMVSVQSNKVQVQYVDYGNGELVDTFRLKQLKLEYLQLPLQCIDCSLDGVPSLEGADAERAIGWMENRTEENLLATVTGIRDGRYIVVLRSEQTGATLNDEIKTILPRLRARTPPRPTPQHDTTRPAHMAQRTPPRPQMQNSTSIPVSDLGFRRTPPRPTPQQDTARPAQPTPPRPQMQNSTSIPVSDLGFWSKVQFGSRECDVYISHVENPGKFFCQLVSQEGELNQLMDDIDSKCSGSQLQRLQKASTGTPCVAQFSEDNSWYRGVVTDQKPSFYEVCFVDYGNKENVAPDKVLEITPDLMALPQQAATCCLSGWDDSWKEANVIEHLKKLSVDVEKFRMVVCESEGMSVIQLKWQGKDMLQELKNVPESIPKEAKQPPKVDTPPRPKENLPAFTIPSAAESVKVGQPVKVAASVVKGPTKFFCQMSSQYDQLQKLSEEMNNHYATSDPSKESLTSSVSGTLCAAQSSSDGAWYRAKIRHETVPGIVKVKFVDYGDDDTLAVASLRNLVPKFRSLPLQAIKCSLIDVRSKFEAAVLDQEATVMVKSKNEGKLVVEYQDESVCSKFTGMFGAVDQATPPQSQEVNQQKASVPKPGYQHQESIGCTNQDVYVTHVDSLQRFYVQLCSRSDEIDMLQQNLKTSYSTDTSRPTVSTAVGTPCCAKFSEDGDWYRAIITSQPSPGKVIVQFVDFGNSEEQMMSDVRLLKPDFLQATKAATECKLKDVKSSSQDSANEFLDLTVDKMLKCQFHGGEEPYQVDFSELQANLKKWQQTDAKQPPSKTLPASKSLGEGTKEEVYISSVTSPSAFWCQLAIHEDTLTTLMDSIDAHYSSVSPGEGRMASPTVGDPCIAQFVEDGGWYRAKITEVSADTCTVLFIDYGNSDKVSRSVIMDIKDKFLAVEQQAVFCSLGGVSPLGETWEGEACDTFSGLTSEKKLLAEVAAFDPESQSHQVTLLDLGMSIRQSLVDSGHAKSAPTTTKTIRFTSESDKVPDQLSGFQALDITQGSSEKVYVTVVNSLHEFYCQFVTKATEDLEPLSEKLQIEAPSLDSLTTTDIVGAPCIAKFSDDEQWYRASILAKQADSLDVFFVDYGNKENVPLNQIKALTPDFSTLPAQAVKCALAHIPTASFSSDAAVAAFENLVLESEGLTAEFVGKKGNFWIVKLLNDGQPVAEALDVELISEISDVSETLPAPLAQPRQSFSWVPLKCQDVVEVFVTKVNSPENFYCQLAKSEDDLNIMMDNIQSLVIPMGDNLRPQDLNLQPGHICLAQCAQDGYWYRSEVTKVMGDSVEVLFVDTGNTKTVSYAKVRAMEADFMDLPRQSLHCKLAGVAPRSDLWDLDSINALIKLTSDHSLMAVVLEVKKSKEGAVTKVLVTLQDGALSVADLLIEKGHAKAVEIPDFEEDKFEEAVEDLVEEIKKVVEIPCWDGPQYENLSLPTGVTKDVVVVSVSSPSEFDCQVVEAETSDVRGKIKSEVDRHVQEMIGHSRLVPAKGMPCLAKCQDETWQRVEILDKPSDDQVKVFLVDEAQKQVVPVVDLQLITLALLALPVQAVKCSLKEAPTGFNWSEEDTSAFKELVAGKTLQAELREEGFVQLFDEGKSVEQLFSDSCAERFEELLKEMNSSAPEVSVFEESDEEGVFVGGVSLPDSFKHAFETLDLQVAQNVTLCLVTVDSPREITCQISHKGQKVLDIEQRMTEVYAEELEPAKETDWVPKPGEPCAAKHSKYEDWYRATIVSVDQEMGVQVYYADYGGTDRIPFESVQQLVEDLREVPAQAMEFRLKNPLMPPLMWNKKTKALMEGQDAERDLHAKVLEVLGNIIVIELAQEDRTFLTDLIDQCQTSSLGNGEEDDDLDGEFFDAVDKASTEMEEALADSDDNKKSETAEAVAALDIGDDINSSVAEVVKDLFQKAAHQAETAKDEPGQSETAEAGASFDTEDDVNTSMAEYVEDIFQKAAHQAVTAKDEPGQSETAEAGAPFDTEDDVNTSMAEFVEDQAVTAETQTESEDTVITEETLNGNLEHSGEAAQEMAVPEGFGGSRMISMKDILDQFVDHTLQQFKQDGDGETTETPDEKDERNVASEVEENERSDLEDGDDVILDENTNGEVSDDTGAVAEDDTGAVAEDDTGAVAEDDTGAVAEDDTGAVAEDVTETDQVDDVTTAQLEAASQFQTEDDENTIADTQLTEVDDELKDLEERVPELPSEDEILDDPEETQPDSNNVQTEVVSNGQSLEEEQSPASIEAELDELKASGDAMLGDSEVEQLDSNIELKDVSNGQRLEEEKILSSDLSEADVELEPEEMTVPSDKEIPNIEPSEVSQDEESIILVVDVEPGTDKPEVVTVSGKDQGVNMEPSEDSQEDGQTSSEIDEEKPVTDSEMASADPTLTESAEIEELEVKDDQASPQDLATEEAASENSDIMDTKMAQE